MPERSTWRRLRTSSRRTNRRCGACTEVHRAQFGGGEWHRAAPRPTVGPNRRPRHHGGFRRVAPLLLQQRQRSELDHLPRLRVSHELHGGPSVRDLPCHVGEHERSGDGHAEPREAHSERTAVLAGEDDADADADSDSDAECYSAASTVTSAAVSAWSNTRTWSTMPTQASVPFARAPMVNLPVTLTGAGYVLTCVPLK